VTQSYEIADTLDVQGASCPTPVVRTKQAVDDVAVGEVVEVLATDPGSLSDIESWAQAADGVALLDQREDDGGDATRYRHHVKRTE
jgi:TusA-related sulfurtransferase